MSGNKWWFPVLFIAIVAMAAFLRLWQLTSVPPSLYWEEVALGYDAYSILQTGKDHHGNAFPIVAFESFGDWKPSLYFYATVPSIAVFGLNDFAVRMPAAVAGIVIVIGMGLLVRFLQQLKDPAEKNQVSAQIWQLVAMGVTAVSPWALIFSRAAWEVNLATALILWGAVAFLYGLLTTRTRWFVVAVVLLCLSMYAYHAARTVAPAVGLGLVWTWWLVSSRSLQQFLQHEWRRVGICVIIAGFMLSPILLSFGAQTNQRFNETNIFADLQLITHSNELRAAADDTLIARLWFHRYLIYGQAMVANALTHLHPSFLFISGDANPRHSIQFMGQLYHVEAVFVLLGLYAAWKYYRRFVPLLLLWLGVGLLTVSLTKAVPHALRLLPTLPVWITLLVWGIQEVYQELRRLAAKLHWPVVTRWSGLCIGLGLVAIYVVELTLFARFYFFVYPKLYAQEYMNGYREMIAQVTTLAAERPDLPIYIAREVGRPAMYYWFYTQTDPRQVQAEEATSRKDQGEFLSFKNVSFPLVTEPIVGPAIVAATPETYEARTGEPLSESTIPHHTIYDTAGQARWVVFTLP